MSLQAIAAMLLLQSDLGWVGGMAGVLSCRHLLARKDQERPLVPKMWSNSLRISSTAWFW